MKKAVKRSRSVRGGRGHKQERGETRRHRDVQVDGQEPGREAYRAGCEYLNIPRSIIIRGMIEKRQAAGSPARRDLTMPPGEERPMGSPLKKE